MHNAPKVRAGPNKDRSNDMSKTDEIKTAMEARIEHLN